MEVAGAIVKVLSVAKTRNRSRWDQNSLILAMPYSSTSDYHERSMKTPRCCAALSCLCLLFSACAEQPQDPSIPTPDLTAFVFVDIAEAAGIGFKHNNGAAGEFNYPEMMQGGVALLDIDGDSFLDVYLVQSGHLGTEGPASQNQLFRNLGTTPSGDLKFENITGSSGAGDTGYGSAAAVGDVDGDGHPDLYVTNLGHNRLLRNHGDGSFEDWTERAGVAGGVDEYSTSAVFFDYDLDLDLDLFVVNYVSWSQETEHACFGPHGVRGYCNPAEYQPQNDRLFRNRGDGTFEDVSRPSGIAALASNGLGITTADFDSDGLIDVYVANDQMANHLWRNQGDGTFDNEALLRGVALNQMGLAEAGMGVTAEDPDNDGDWDLFVTHLSHETNTFYRNDGGGVFTDTTDAKRLGVVSQPYTGFGTGLYDLDLDGQLDLFISNGKVSQTDAGEPSFAEPNQLLRGSSDGSFESVTLDTTEWTSGVSRGAAFGDLDNDGDIDIVVVNNDAAAQVLRNESARSGHWLAVEVTNSAGAPAHGAVVTLSTQSGGETLTRQRRVQPASSYCSSNSPVVHFGFAKTEQALAVDVEWPDGGHEVRATVAGDERVAFRQKTNGGA